MRIVMFSINPIFPDRVTGGASKHLFHIARHLGQEGHSVRILCAEPEGALAPFTWSDNVQVLPVLPFKQPFPQPYGITGDALALIVARLAQHLSDADKFYLHDGEFLLPDVYARIPTVASLRDNIYPESVLGSFLGKFDDLICVSAFSADVVRHTAGRFYPDLPRRMHVVNNGIDFETFRPRNAADLARELGLDPQEQTILLHPHRPERGKGLPETIKVVYQLIHHHGIENIRVLVPEWIDSMLSGEEDGFYREMMTLMADLGIREQFLFIPWLPQDQMPVLYSLGQVTLCLGQIVEAFGNVAYESLACGTPSVVARVGVHRTMLPDDVIEKVDFGDIEGAAAIVAAYLRDGAFDAEAVLAVLKDRMDFAMQVNAYSRLITRCEKRAPLTFQWESVKPETWYRLAPWCGITGDRIYHDFKGRYTQDPHLAALGHSGRHFTRDAGLKAGVSPAAWDAWLDGTWIVPVVEN